MKALAKMEQAAIAELDNMKNRSQYCRDVVCGVQNISGSDLRGNARKFGASYHAQVKNALHAVRKTGLGADFVLPKQHGKRVFGAYCGMDDFGNALIDTDYGVKIYGTTAK